LASQLVESLLTIFFLACALVRAHEI
jgi:hypothetical protein